MLGECVYHAIHVYAPTNKNKQSKGNRVKGITE